MKTLGLPDENQNGTMTDFNMSVFHVEILLLIEILVNSFPKLTER